MKAHPDRMKALAAKGLTRREAAQALGMTYTGLCVAATRHGVRFKRAPGTGDPQKRNRKVCPDKLRKLAAEGYSQATAALMLGCTRERVRQIADRDGILFESGLVDYDRRQRVWALHEEGLTTAEIAEHLQSSQPTVSKDLKAGGLTPHRKTGHKSARLRVLLASGYTLTEAARELGWDTQSAWTTARRLGITDYAGKRGTAQQ